MKISKLNIVIRSFIFWLIETTLIVFYSLIVTASIPFSLQRRQRIIHSFLQLTIFLLRYICYVNYEISGQENIPKHGNGIVMSNHQSTWETFFLPFLFSNFVYIAKRELLWVPFFGWGFRASDPITINRGDGSSAMQQVISKGTACLEEGRWVIVFPEGTRIAYGKTGAYKLGGARLAAATGYPIVPIAHNAGKYWPKRQFIKVPGTIKVVIGPVIETKNQTPEEILAKTKAWIEATVRTLE